MDEVTFSYTFFQVAPDCTPDTLEKYLGVRELPKVGDEFVIVCEKVDEKGAHLQLRPRQEAPYDPAASPEESHYAQWHAARRDE